MNDLPPLDYLAIGHIAVDVTPGGERLGGSVAFAALTARALGLRAGIVTAAADDAPLAALGDIPMVVLESQHSTTFENVSTANGRAQTLHHHAARIAFENIPAHWCSAPIIHLAPIAHELDEGIAKQLTPDLLGITPQGWLRAWDENGRIHANAWENRAPVLGPAGAVVLSSEDVGRDLELIEALAHETRVLCVTEGASGAVLHWNGDRRRFRAPQVDELDATGAGDIFAAAFFIRLHVTRDPWEAARFATALASCSVTRAGLDGIPTPREIDECLMEVLS